MVAGSEWQESGLVFATPLGTPIRTHSLHRTFEAMLRDAGLPDIRYHDLPHTAATLLLAQGRATADGRYGGSSACASKRLRCVLASEARWSPRRSAA